MGNFLAASAFRGVAIELVRHAIVVDVRSFGVESAEVSREEPEEPDRDVRLFYGGPWTVVLWPDHFNIHDVPSSQRLSTALGCTISTVHVYDDAYWAHHLIEGGRVVDRFCSRPTYFGPDGSDPTRWAGDAAVLAGAAGTDPATIAPYLVHLEPPPRGWRGRLGLRRPPRHGKANADDRFELDDPWVFTDFWRRMAITYPQDVASATRRLRLAAGWADRLPTLDDL